MNPGLYDAHNHLQDDRLAPCRESVLAALQRENVVKMVVNGSCEQDWPAVLELARRHPVQGELKILAFARGFLTPLPLPRAWRRFAAP